MGKNISIIIPVYCNEGSLKITYENIVSQVINKWPDKNFELIFIDDGSIDNSYSELINLFHSHPDIIRIIKFPRNFGQVSAILAGYIYSKGECIINISADLQDPPSLMNEMIKAYEEEHFEIAIATRIDRDESLGRKLTSKFFYNIIKKTIFKTMPTGGFDFVMISNKIKNIIISNKESNPFWQGQILWTGYPIKYFPYERKKRIIGESKWTFSKKIKYLIDGILAYSYLPLRIMSLLGIILFLLGIIYSLVILINYFFGNIPFKGWAPIMILILTLSGIQMLMLGIIGEYLWRTLDQVRNRPQYLIEETHGFYEKIDN